MRKLALFFLLTFFNLYGQEPKKIVDTTAIILKGFKQVDLLDSLIDKRIFQASYIKTNDSIEKNYLSKVHKDTLIKRLELLNSKTPINIEYNPVLESIINNYLATRKVSFERLAQRSQYYFPLFEEVLDAHNVPLEIKYLSIVESALNPKAKSPVGASGLWQFMFSTSKMYGLEVNSYIDERFDPVKSTKAAAKYLNKLYDIFGDWSLALAAYNSGPGNVTKAMRRSGGYRNYWNIRPFLPKETANYIPAFFATLYIFEFADQHGFHNKPAPFSIIETDTVLVKEMLHFNHLVDALNIEKEILEFLNPSYKLNIVPYIKGKRKTLRLPKPTLGKFLANEDEIYAFSKNEFDKREKPLPKFYKMNSRIRYIVKSGDYLGKIAKKFKVKIKDIRKWNSLKNDLINVGDRLIIYTKSTDVKLDINNGVETDIIPNNNYYTVKKGDSFWTIAQKLPNISVEDLKKWNDISSKDLKPGMKLSLTK